MGRFMDRGTDNNLDLSLIIPVHNEEESLPRVYGRLKEVFGESDLACEVIFVDDGSMDNSLSLLREIKEKSADRLTVRIVQLRRNYGQHPAICAGFSVARGRVLATLDADLQIDPKYILLMMKKIEMGYDFVSGVRRGIGDSFFFRRVPSKVLGFFMGIIIGKRLRDYNCPVNAMRVEIAAAMREYAEQQRYYKALAIKLATRIAEMEVVHDRRAAGPSRYGFLNLVDLFFDFVTNFSGQLFQKVALVGASLSGLSFLSGVVYFLVRFPLGILHEPSNKWQVISLTVFVFGTQLLVMGILGDFVIRIYRKVRPEPMYEIQRSW
jgi:undecaprenyl-phosphate 4-deoxy-4-formamido-L-arabinose transferase